MLTADGFDKAFIGVGLRAGQEEIVVYDFDICVAILCERDNMELDDAIEIDRLLLEIHKHNPKLKISVINICAAGNSYQYLRRNFPKRTMDNEYLAITKLDLCDLSLSEISAFVELNQKCMFFSGIETEADGIFFAQVEKVMSHIVKTIGSEELE